MINEWVMNFESTPHWPIDHVTVVNPKLGFEATKNYIRHAHAYCYAKPEEMIEREPLKTCNWNFHHGPIGDFHPQAMECFCVFNKKNWA